MVKSRSEKLVEWLLGRRRWALWLIVGLLLTAALTGYCTSLVNAADVDVPPELLMGEASVCGMPGMVAVWHVAQNRGTTHGFYGWQEPDAVAQWVAQNGGLYRDPTAGATHIFSVQDLLRTDVQAIIRDMVLVWQMDCAGGLGLYAFGR